MQLMHVMLKYVKFPFMNVYCTVFNNGQSKYCWCSITKATRYVRLSILDFYYYSIVDFYKFGARTGYSSVINEKRGKST